MRSRIISLYTQQRAKYTTIATTNAKYEPTWTAAGDVHVPINVEVQQFELGEGAFAQRSLFGGDEFHVRRCRIHANAAVAGLKNVHK